MNFDCVFLSKDSRLDNGHGHEKRGLWETYALTVSVIYPSCSSIEPGKFKEILDSYLCAAKLECTMLRGEGEDGFLILNTNFFEMYLLCSKMLSLNSFIFAELLDKGICLYNMKWSRKEKRFRQEEEKVYSGSQLEDGDLVLSLQNSGFSIKAKDLLSSVSELSGSFYGNYGYLEHGVLKKIVEECCHSSMDPETLVTYRRIHLVKESEMDDANELMRDLVRRNRQEKRTKKKT